MVLGVTFGTSVVTAVMYLISVFEAPPVSCRGRGRWVCLFCSTEPHPGTRPGEPATERRLNTYGRHHRCDRRNTVEVTEFARQVPREVYSALDTDRNPLDTCNLAGLHSLHLATARRATADTPPSQSPCQWMSSNCPASDVFGAEEGISGNFQFAEFSGLAEAGASQSSLQHLPVGKALPGWGSGWTTNSRFSNELSIDAWGSGATARRFGPRPRFNSGALKTVFNPAR